MKTTRLALAGLLLLGTACTAPPTATAAAPSPPAPGLSTVVLLGDSIAVGEALPLAAALEAGGVGFRSLAAEGGGNVVGPFAEEQWADLPQRIADARPSVVLYQLSTFDWGTGAEQRAAYDRLLGAVTATGADLLFVTAPPIRPDEFYAPHTAELARAPEVARAVAAASPQRAGVLDAGAVWGETYQRERDGLADRNPDGVHTCPQGAARFTSWLLGELAARYPGFTPAPAADWAEAGWAADDHFAAC